MTLPGIHPAADIFPPMAEREFTELVADIRAHGLREPVVLHKDGRIIDGRHRARACAQLGIQPATQTFNGDDADVVAFVLSLNLHRRHLDETQRAMVGARIKKLPVGANQHWVPDTEAGLWEDIVGEGRKIFRPSQADVAEMLNVSDRSIRHAQTVQESGVPELVEMVDAGEVAVSTAAAIATEAPEVQRDVIDAGDERAIIRAAKEIKERRRVERQAEKWARVDEIRRGEAEPLGAVEAAHVIYADPPWRYEHSETSTREIENHYPTMTFDDLAALEIPAADDAVLFLWATSPKLLEAVALIDAWGFSYRTCMVWVKDKIGMGYYARQQHELLLIAKRGELPVPAPEDRPPSVVEGVRGEHSAKPERFYELIERMYPTYRCVEMFARNTRPGWHAWGNQAKASA